MTSETDRNPSPPFELLQNDEDFLPDRIGDSVYSKQWLLQVLIKIMETSNQDEKMHSSLLCSENNSPTKSNDIVELDSKIEEEACLLWDMSANVAVANFLHEFRASEIFCEVIDKTRSPRLLEIVIGIIGNMASINGICLDLSRNESLVTAVISLLGTSDSPTIVQIFRLIHSGMVNKNTRNLWMPVLLRNSFFMETMKFILENALHGDILKGALQLMYYIFDEDERSCLAWCDEEHVNTFINAGKQLMILGDQESLDKYWLVLNVLCQYEPNIRTLARKYKYFTDIFHSYFMRFGDHEDVLPPISRVLSVAACFSTYATLLKSEFLNDEMVENEFVLLAIFHKIFFSVHEILLKIFQSADLVVQDVNSPQPSSDEETGNRQVFENDKTLSERNWFILQKSMVHAATVLKSFVDEGDVRAEALAEIITSEMKVSPLSNCELHNSV